MTHVPSSYNVIEHTRYGWLCWNTISGVLRQIGQAEVQMLSGKTVLEPGYFAKRKLFSALCDAGMLVPESLDEFSMLEQDLRADPQESIFRILTTTACNAACDYCYEQGFAPVSMDCNTALSVAEFIASVRFEHGMFPTLEWFGGEPLLNHRAITDICRELGERGVRFASKISTNGSLWTEDIVDTAKRIWNLRSVQTTFDGTELIHERTKHLPAGTYKRTIESCRKLLDQNIQVRVRIIHIPGRIEAEHELIEDLTQAFCKHEAFSVYATPAYRAGTFHPPDTMREVLALERHIRDAGLDGCKSVQPGTRRDSGEQQVPILPRRRHSGCFMCSPGNYTIAPDGKLYNCSHTLYGSQCVGTVWDYSPEQEYAHPHAAFLRRDVSGMCRECKLLPVCMGGCRVAELGLAPMTQCPPAKSVIPQLMEEAYGRMHPRNDKA